MNDTKKHADKYDNTKRKMPTNVVLPPSLTKLGGKVIVYAENKPKTDVCDVESIM